MALRSGYKGFKKLINGLKLLRPGVLGIDIGTGLAIGQDGKLNVTGVGVTVAGNPEEAATAGDLTKLQIGSDIFNVPDTTYSNATTSEAGLMSAADKRRVDILQSTKVDLDVRQTMTEHEISNASYSKYGKIITLMFEIKSLTINSAPSGTSWITLFDATDKPVPVPKNTFGYNAFNFYVLSSADSDHKVEISVGNANVTARGGTQGSTYKCVVTYVED